MGSNNPTPSVPSNLVNYGIILSSFSVVVEKTPTAVQIGHTGPILWIDFKPTKTSQPLLKGEIELSNLELDST
ncbi:MAG: hypothetical protein ACJ70Q_06740 [Nitrososphaera sp.]